MADYKELLRRAVEALPENNGAARRAVYEKARAALVGQLRAINPPLAARDITAHRLQLEDCIRQVEQEASEAVIAGIAIAPREEAPPPPVYFEPPAKKPQPATPPVVARPAPSRAAGAQGKAPSAASSIEDIIAEATTEPETPPVRPRLDPRPAAAESRPSPAGSRAVGRPLPKPSTPARATPQARIPLGSAPAATPTSAGPSFSPRAELPRSEPKRAETPRSEVPVAAERPAFTRPTPQTTAPTLSDLPSAPQRALPPIVARAEAAKARSSAAPFGGGLNGSTPPRRAPIGPRLDGADTADGVPDGLPAFPQGDVPPAMSAVREVDADLPADPQNTIDRAIATLDREARSDGFSTRGNEMPRSGRDIFGGDTDDSDSDDRPIGRSEDRRDGRPARRSRVDAEPSRTVRPRARIRGKGVDFVPARGRDDRGLSPLSIFGIVFGVLLVAAAGLGVWAWREGFLDIGQMLGGAQQTEVAAADAAPAKADAEAPATGPGNTDTPVAASPTAELKSDGNADRLATETPAVPAADSQQALQTASSEERLGADTGGANATAAATAATAAAGSQSLLLEANDVGKTGAVPFSGTIEWSQGKDETGLPTLVGKANIPARNLGVELLIRKNSDPSLPASHLMEVNFKVNESFVGGSIAGLPGVLLKNEELVQGTPLVGASARVVGNSFLFALSAAQADVKVNSDLLTGRKWIDLALIYATGKRAIITLEKDDAAMALFNQVMAAWNSAAPATAAQTQTN